MEHQGLLYIVVRLRYFALWWLSLLLYNGCFLLASSEKRIGSLPTYFLLTASLSFAYWIDEVAEVAKAPDLGKAPD
ncbi:unnamed protein product [Cyprideis torosa]|uniref:Uncharacterized protein n=1 Tax=Cyprideis torosa TaxID=163714 RepID=A0A7R8WB81_9CRUS|nr:unnamed protein product [Cyprideis torosa]CAG0892019.1 unnamed protein product [Cyprideis torosa]